MSATFTRFEIRLPIHMGDNNPRDVILDTFLNSLSTLTPYTLLSAYQVDSSHIETQYDLVFGLLTPAQSLSALTLLNSLNSALGFQVMCYTWPVTSQP